MLIPCPECELQISDKAIACPHCGYPIQKPITKQQTRKPNKRRRLPNGFGQISEIKNRNLRKPFRAMITIGKTDTGKPICKPLKPESYFETYNDAYQALINYNKNPYDLNAGMTLAELYDKWLPEYEQTVKTTSPMRNAWLYCSSIYKMKVADIRPRHIKGCIESGPTPVMKSKIKVLFNLMLDYATEYEIVDHNYSRAFNLPDKTIKALQDTKNGHIPFTQEEMKLLWDNIDTIPSIDILIIQCYSGWRPQELGLIEIKNIDLVNWTYSGRMKTDSGVGRTGPIHSRIRPFIQAKYKEAVGLGSPYLLNFTLQNIRTRNHKLTYDRYLIMFEQIIKVLELNPKHRPHDGRKHFVTMAKKYGVDEYAIKYIVGHKISDITEKTYTKRDPNWLSQEIEKIP